MIIMIFVLGLKFGLLATCLSDKWPTTTLILAWRVVGEAVLLWKGLVFRHADSLVHVLGHFLTYQNSCVDNQVPFEEANFNDELATYWNEKISILPTMTYKSFMNWLHPEPLNCISLLSFYCSACCTIPYILQATSHSRNSILPVLFT